MKYQFVLQWSATSMDDFDTFIAVEEFLRQNLSELHDVDGHDMGCGELNIFIQTDAPKTLFSEIRGLFGMEDNLATAKIAYRERRGETYVVLWPEGVEGFKVS